MKKYEEIYQMNKDMCIRLFNRDGFLPMGKSYQSRYNSIRASMDVKGVEHMLEQMLAYKWGKKSQRVVLMAWVNKEKSLLRQIKMETINEK